MSSDQPNSAIDCERSESPVRVLLVAPSLSILGGQAVQANRLLNFLSKENAVVVDLLPVNPCLPGILSTLQSIKYVRTVVTSAAYIASLLLRVWRYDVIHIFSASYLSFLLAPTPAIFVSKLYRKKTILNYRSGEAEDHLTRSRVAVHIMKMVDLLIVPSCYLVDVFRKFDLEARWIFNFVQLDQFRWRERNPLRPSFLSNRNFEAHYNVKCVLKAFQLIQQRFSSARLLIAGDGPERDALNRLSQELNLQEVTFLGTVTQEEMANLYDSTDIYLNCSDIDNMPGFIIEAFACGLPVVTTNAGGIPYIVTDGQTGLLANCGDYQAIANNAIRLLEQPELAQVIIRQAFRECDKYQWQSVRKQWLDTYIDLTRADTATSSQFATASKEKL